VGGSYWMLNERLSSERAKKFRAIEKRNFGWAVK